MYNEDLWWIGASDKEEEGVWTWESDGEKVLSFLWAPQQPDGKLKENCCQLGWDSEGYHDVPCDFGVERNGKKFKPICQFNVSNVSINQ